MDTVTILLSAFILSVTGLLVFIWSLRKGLLDRDPAGARTIFITGEIGHAEEPATTPMAMSALQQTVDRAVDQVSTLQPDQMELKLRIAADQSSARPTFIFLSCAVTAERSATKARHEPWKGGDELAQFR